MRFYYQFFEVREIIHFVVLECGDNRELGELGLFNIYELNIEED